MLTGHLLYTNTRHYLFFVVISFMERAKLSPIEIQIREKKMISQVPVIPMSVSIINIWDKKIR